MNARRTRVMAELRRPGRVRPCRSITYPVVLGVLLPWTHAAIRYRERARLKQALLYSRCRRIALAIGDELATSRDDRRARRRVLPHRVGADRAHRRARRCSRAPFASIVATRKAEHARLSATTPPDAFTLARGRVSRRRDAAPRRDDESTDADESLRGTSACGGRVTGRATVLRDVTEAVAPRARRRAGHEADRSRVGVRCSF